MITRKLVVIIGFLLIVMGILQIAARERVEVIRMGILAGSTIYVPAGLSAVIGIVLVWAGLRQLVRISRLVMVLGLLTFLSGIFIGVAPEFARDLIDSLYFNRSESYRVAAGWIGGLVRIALGILLIYAGIKPPAPRTPRLGSIVPLA